MTLTLAQRLTAPLRSIWQAVTPTERALILSAALFLVLMPK